MYDLVHIIHLFAVFIYAGFLFTDMLFFSRMKNNYSPEEYMIIRNAFMDYVKKVVPWALLIAVLSGIYLFVQVFGEIAPEGLSRFQVLLSIKGFLGLWLGMRGVLQKFFGIEPLVFKQHTFPFILVILVILLSQVMYL